MPTVRPNFTAAHCTILSVTFQEYLALPEEIRIPEVHKIMQGCGIYAFKIKPENISDFKGTLMDSMPVGNYIIYLADIMARISEAQLIALIHHEAAVLLMDCPAQDFDELTRLIKADAHAARVTSQSVVCDALLNVIMAATEFMQFVKPEFSARAIADDIVAHPQMQSRLQALGGPLVLPSVRPSGFIPVPQEPSLVQ